LLRVERASALGGWSYDIADTKLARRLKVPALLQMATYAVRLEHLQGIAPQWLTVVAGDNEHHPWRLVDVSAYTRRARQRLTDAVAERPKTHPAPVAYCGQCRWEPRCSAQWRAQDDLCLVAGIRSDQRESLRAEGINTLTDLAQADPEDTAIAAALSPRSRRRLQRQAALQHSEQITGEPTYHLLPAEPGRGLQLLPPPDQGDVYLDFEGDPFAPGGQGLEYLAGVTDRDDTFVTWWAHDAAGERVMVADLLDWLVRRWEEYPAMHVYHYANYEQAALKRLTAREAVAETELDMLLRGERLVDLYAVVRQGIQISKRSYSIKKLESFYWKGERPSGVEGAVDNAMASVVEYEKWAASDRTDATILDRIAAYNRQDVRSTLALHDWLEQRRTELARGSEESLARPGAKVREEAKDSEAIEAENAMAERLAAAGHELLAGCLGWHRREEKQMWWEYFRTSWMSEEELIEDPLTIGALGPPQPSGEVARSFIWRYAFPPQECRIGGSVHDVVEHQPVGTVWDLDLEAGWIDIKRGKNHPPLEVSGLVGGDFVRTTALRESLMRTAADRLSGGVSAATALLDRRVPDGLDPVGAESAADVVRRVGVGLSLQVLAVQGPPGTGKTYAGQLLIGDLLDAGLKVGVTAGSHSVVAELMRKTRRRGMRKTGMEQDLGDIDPDDLITLTPDNAVVEAALASGETSFVGGTAWLWSRPEMRSLVDVLVIDEAGQFSLANALAVAPCADSLVLLGDPQQLASPSHGVHPYGAGVSALEHMLEGAAVIPTGRGVFLDRTWRMHPIIADFVSTLSYEGRLESAPGRDVQRVGGVPAGSDSGLSGAGLRWCATAHQGFSSQNPVEAQVVGDLVARLLQGYWVDAEDVERPVRPQDVLVVAPYNAHVAEVLGAVPEGVMVGTVDKFQGRQAAVVIYTMASSSAEDAPRGVDFLYDTHRLNVAISRAKAMAIIVGSPQLLQAPARTPEQLRAVNALCRFVEVAEPCS
ncbi:MAG: TM0106 family RecB-like putative nuclease, partial [Ornithinimicrobium sp.]